MEFFRKRNMLGRRKNRHLNVLYRDALKCIYRHHPTYKEDIIQSINVIRKSSLKPLDLVSEKVELSTQVPISCNQLWKEGLSCLVVEKGTCYMEKTNACILCKKEKICPSLTDQSIIEILKQYNNRSTLDNNLKNLLVTVIIPSLKQSSYGQNMLMYDKLNGIVEICKIIYMLFVQHIEIFLVAMHVNNCIKNTKRILNGAENDHLSMDEHISTRFILPDIAHSSEVQVIKDVVIEIFTTQEILHLCNFCCRIISILLPYSKLNVCYNKETLQVRLIITLQKPLDILSMDTLYTCDPIFEHIKALIKV